ncbi:MAG: TonB-dependent receptor [Acidobacteriota bacterium]
MLRPQVIRWAWILGVVVAMLAPTTLSAETLRGQVKDPSGAVLPGVTITAVNTASGRSQTTVTDDQGNYEFSDLAPAAYRVSTQLDGFADSAETVNVSQAEVTADFQLALGALVDELTVTAARGERSIVEIPQAVTVVSSADIEDRRPQSVQEAYERVPNMQSIEQNQARSRPTYRGQSSSRLLLLLDGERINNSRIDANATGLSPGMIDVTQLAAIEVVGGAGSSLYGTDAHAGTINLITKAPSRPSSGATWDAILDLGYNDNGGFNRQFGSLSYGTEAWGLQASASVFDQDDYEIGGDAITTEEVLALGEVSNLLAGNANTYAIWSLGENGEIRNGQGEGTNGRLDFWRYFNGTHSLRATYLLSEHEDLGFAFSGPPFSNNRTSNNFRDFTKLTLRYEGSEIADWLPRVAVRVYQQEFERPQNDRRFNIDEGSSFVTNPDRSLSFTGNPSTFNSGGTFSTTLNSITSTGAEVQLNLAASENALITTGIQYLKDESEDTFTRDAFNGAGTVTSTVVGATTPDTDYENLAAFAQLEWQPHEVVRVAAGVRWDDWESTAQATDGYPLPGGSELGFLGIASGELANRLESDFGFNLDGVADFVQAIRDGQDFSTSNDVVTGNVGLTFFLPAGISPYVRWGESYREPEVTVRYLVRNFGSGFFGVQSVPNPFLEPEEGTSIDLGVKVDQGNWRGSLAWFRNEIDNYIDGIVTPTLFFTPDPANGVFSPVGLFFQRVNATEVEFEGTEAYFEGSFPVGNRGSLTPYVSLSWLEGQNKNPTPAEIQTIEQFYNRSDLPIDLEGTPDDAPFGSVVPFQGTFALRYTNATGKWFSEYEFRFADDITRVRPESVATGNITQFGILKSLDGFEKHSLRGGYTIDAGGNPLKLTLGIENLTDDLYFLPFQIAPAPGRSFVLGLNYKFGSR